MNNFRPAVHRALSTKVPSSFVPRLCFPREPHRTFVTLLIHGAHLDATMVANQLGCSTKTVHRAIADIRKAGWPVNYDFSTGTFSTKESNL